MVRGGLLEAALDDHPLAVPLAAVAGRAEDVEPLAAADEERLVERDGGRELGDELPVGADAGVEDAVLAEPAAGDRAGGRDARGEAVAVELAPGEGALLRLVVHPLPAPGAGEGDEGERGDAEARASARRAVSSQLR